MASVFDTNLMLRVRGQGQWITVTQMNEKAGNLAKQLIEEGSDDFDKVKVLRANASSFSLEAEIPSPKGG